MCRVMLFSKHLSSLKPLVALVLLCSSVGISAQNEKQQAIVKADSTWSTEIIPFPIDWATKITYSGFEELRFAPNWNNVNHQEFWTLVMSWQVETKTEIPLEDLQFNLNHYFTELMKPNHWAQEFPDPELALSDLEVSESGTQFKGEMTFFDGFHTGKVITVKILGSQRLCKTSGKAFVIFKLSPKAYGQPIWKQLNAIALKEDACVD
ncbi:MAG: hypothetical protein AB8B52_10900 [Winogradskyella sp.]|uniref:hypothetical protein n=1 Tax=Winogradskyella sp. TaxID=1883156 RepID=UPI00385C72FE